MIIPSDFELRTDVVKDEVRFVFYRANADNKLEEIITEVKEHTVSIKTIEQNEDVEIPTFIMSKKQTKDLLIGLLHQLIKTE